MSTAHSRSPRGRERALRLFAAVVAALVAAAAIPAGLAFADSSGSVTETIHTGLLSVTLSTSSVDLCSASDPLGFPNGPAILQTSQSQTGQRQPTSRSAVVRRHPLMRVTLALGPTGHCAA